MNKVVESSLSTFYGVSLCKQHTTHGKDPFFLPLYSRIRIHDSRLVYKVGALKAKQCYFLLMLLLYSVARCVAFTKLIHWKLSLAFF